MSPSVQSSLKTTARERRRRKRRRNQPTAVAHVRVQLAQTDREPGYILRLISTLVRPDFISAT